MHYDPRKHDHNLKRDPFTALVVPRPIAWISTLSGHGSVNLAPFSFFNIASTRPPAVMFSTFGLKDTRRNAERSGEFVVNLVPAQFVEAMNETSRDLPEDVSEAVLARVELAPSRSIAPPRVKAAPVALECTYLKTVPLAAEGDAATGNFVVFGSVVGVFIEDAMIDRGYVRWPQESILFRLGYMDYGFVGKTFEMLKPS